MKTKFDLHQHSWIIFIFLLASACAPGKNNITPTQTIDITAIYNKAFSTAINGMKQIATTQPNSTPNILPTNTPNSTALQPFPLDGYVMVFIKDGDLYFQDGNHSPTKLTYIGKKHNDIKLSDDNQKIIFSRQDQNEYSINTNGTQERIIIPSNFGATLATGINGSLLDFVPTTHQLLFETYSCKSKTFRSLCSMSIFLTDIDTGKIKKLADLGLIHQQDSSLRNVEISPNGKMIAVGTKDGMDIFNTDGKIIRQKILPYTPSTSTVLFPALFWLPDSSGLIVALPNATYPSFLYDKYPGHTLWRYIIDGSVVSQIHLLPPLPGNGGTNDFSISPDGNWSIYGGLGDGDPIYLVNLTNGQKQKIGNDTQPSFSWAPDSKHFIYTSLTSTLGAVSQPSNITPICHLDKWIDTDHFTCWSHEKIMVAKIGSDEITMYDLGFDKNIDAFVLIKPK